uniref:Plant heme peroxidase family profile domain-containing protein n=1 Tax=Aegilops tauschii subsp. strangulata TaxID=200361 RepID=A0A453APL3_AEGTS
WHLHLYQSCYSSAWPRRCRRSCRPRTHTDKSCPSALSKIQAGVAAAVASDRRMAASLLRLHFHDCFVQGCDASVLLNETSVGGNERGAFGNVGSLRGFAVIEQIKKRMWKPCAKSPTATTGPSSPAPTSSPSPPAILSSRWEGLRGRLSWEGGTPQRLAWHRPTRTCLRPSWTSPASTPASPARGSA